MLYFEDSGGCVIHEGEPKPGVLVVEFTLFGRVRWRYPIYFMQITMILKFCIRESLITSCKTGSLITVKAGNGCEKKEKIILGGEKGDEKKGFKGKRKQ
ncbi:hypothetical protein Hdeb2414_s0013g00408271 [Helianthus debilis subsp. tardiflorus]